jgi:hypothetical protein
MVAMVSVVCGCVSTPRSQIDAGPIYQRDVDLHGNRVLQAVGPLIEKQASPSGMDFKALRPFWSRVADTSEDRTVSDFLWPIGMSKVRQGERDWRFFPAYGHDFDISQRHSRHRWAVFPFLFGGRSLQNERYFSVFPFGGTLHEFLGRDRILFVLFPLYAYSEMNAIRTHSILWPIYSRSKGDGVDRLRVWPFYGISRNVDRWTKRFVMWPFWTSVQYEYPDQKGGGFVFFPFYGQVDVGDRHARMLVPPFFKVEWAGESHLAWNAPWPFLQYSRGEIDKLYVWPLYGRKQAENEKQWFALWPLISHRQTTRPDVIRKHFRAVPLVYFESTIQRQMVDAHVETENEALSRYFKLWPLFSYRREANCSMFRVLALWPLKRTPGIERNWAPLWSVFTRQRLGETIDSELLWGLYRRRRSPDGGSLSVFPFIQSRRDDDTRSWSLLYGLMGCERAGTQRRWQFLYFMHIGGREQNGDQD